MKESSDFRRGIVQLEWEYKKMSMQMEDLNNKIKDIQSFKVSREVQDVSWFKNYVASSCYFNFVNFCVRMKCNFFL